MRTKIILTSIAIVMLAICVLANAAPPASSEVSILGVDSTAFPKVSVNVFVNTSCASAGGLQKEDFSLEETGSKVAIDNFFFTGRANGKSVDLVVVFDDTSSMSPQIEIMKSRVQGLIDQIAGSDLNARYALVSFKDSESESLRSSWTTNATSFKRVVNSMEANGGGDTPENALDAIEAALSLGFRPEAQKVVLVITDTSAHQKGDGTTVTQRTEDVVKNDLLRSGAMIIVVSPVLPSYVAPFLDLKNLAGEVGGTWIDMASADFSNILDHITTMITGMYIIEYTSPDLSQKPTRSIQITVNNSSCASGQATSTYPLPGSLPGSTSVTQPIRNKIPNFSYSGDGQGGPVVDPFASDGLNVYKVALDKRIEKPVNGGCQDIVIDITPDKIPTKDYVVFAIDHSGSTYQGKYSQDIVNGISDALASTSGVRYQRVDWNDRTVYSSKQFNDSSNWINEDQRPEGPDYPSSSLVPRPEEEQPTWYSAGLKEAVDKIVAQKNSVATTPLAKKTTGWNVIFITGSSEFSRGVLADYNGAITRARDEGVNIYTMGIQISSTDPTTSNERIALQNEMPVNSGFGLLQDTDPSVRNFVGKGIQNILSSSGGYYSGSVARNVTITESIYPYLSPIGSSMQPISQKVNPDRSTTMKFDLGNLKGGETKTIRIYTALDLSNLPVDINKSKSRVDFSPDTTTPPSIVTYTSLIDELRTMDMPEGQLSIFCGTPCPPTTPSTVVVANETKPSETKKPVSIPSEKSPGFEVIFAAVGIMVAYMLRRW